MKLRIDVDPALTEPEIAIRCPSVDEDILRLQEYVNGLNTKAGRIVFRKEHSEYYFPVSRVLFFETTSGDIAAHTADDVFFVSEKLYELEELLPQSFIRISKSAIINTGRIYSIDRNLTGASKVRFIGSSKIVYVSRSYYAALKERLILNSVKGDRS